MIYIKLLDDYQNLRNELFDYFGYVEDWKVIPIDDCRGYIWYLTGEGAGDSVYFAESFQDFEEGEYYSNEIYAQRFLPKWVYRGKEYTMICVDTRTDDNKFLAIYENSKEMTEDQFEKLNL